MNKKINSAVAYLILIFISLICGICVMSAIQKKANEEVSLILQPSDVINFNTAEADTEN